MKDDEKDEKDENDEKYEKNDEKCEDLPNCSGISFNFLSQGLIDRKESQKKGPQKRTLTPSSVRSERKTAEFEARDQFLKKLRPVNSPMKSDGQRKRFGEKRKLNLMGDSNENPDSFSPRKVPRK